MRLAGFAPDAVRAFVLSNDPVPRMWLAADPLFGAAAANETVKAVLGARSWLFGDGILSERRFLYEAVGTLYWLTWSAADGTRLTVHDGGADAMVEKLRMTPPWETGAVGAVAGVGPQRAKLRRRRAVSRAQETRQRQEQEPVVKRDDDSCNTVPRRVDEPTTTAMARASF